MYYTYNDVHYHTSNLVAFVCCFLLSEIWWFYGPELWLNHHRRACYTDHHVEIELARSSPFRALV